MSTSLLALQAGDDPAAWRALGFSVERHGRLALGAVEIVLDGTGGGLRRWTLAGQGGDAAVDGIATVWSPAGGSSGGGGVHENGASALDHVVLVTPDRDRTVDALEAVGGDVRRRFDSPPMPAPMAFVRLGPAMIEVVQRDDAAAPFLWGLVAVVDDVDALAARYGALVGAPRDAVQPGRRIVTAAPVPGLETALAFITPR